MSLGKQLVTLRVNGTDHEIAVEPWRTLDEVLRDQLGLVGTKRGCGEGDCGACTVLIDGRSAVSCLTLAMDAQGRDIRTIEGLARSREVLHPLQQAFVTGGAIQCGYCTPGMVLSALSLLENNADPTEEEIRKGLSGNLCRCTGYARIVEAIREAAKELRDGTDTERP